MSARSKDSGRQPDATRRTSRRDVRSNGVALRTAVKSWPGLCAESLDEAEKSAMVLAMPPHPNTEPR